MDINLQPMRRTDWRVKVRVKRMWRQINHNVETVGISLIFSRRIGKFNLLILQILHTYIFVVLNGSVSLTGRTHSYLDSCSLHQSPEESAYRWRNL
ncbi:hypothetical protein DCAR_0831220 [Daucus carota subsp. sativus]|uniref:Uncharacterized protein n=1 Tax=Daucus carota subsp. sativus TaxID=79200 RepID=A0A175YM15_DAUCS|nr:hypothetical protein DCAR_0831220 [Daucus carota subsp. sativus]